MSFGAICSDNLPLFFEKSLQILNPAQKIYINWSHYVICDYLEKVANGEITRLIINLPPRNLKSIITSVIFPAWFLAKYPNKKIMVASYSNTLAVKHSLDCRLLVASDWYSKSFPYSSISKSKTRTKNKFINISEGYRFGTSVGGTVTGEGGDILILDDPNSPNDIASKKSRINTIDWYRDVFLTRLNDKHKGGIICVMQRLHEEDLTGYILKNDKDAEWIHLSLPAISLKEEMFLFSEIENMKKINSYYLRKKGEILNSEYESQEVLNRIQKDMGINNFLAQYQQTPVSISGKLFFYEWLNFISMDDDIQNLDFYMSIDSASGINLHNDFSAIVVFCAQKNISNNSIILYDILTEKLNYPNLKSLILKIYNIYKPKKVLIENKASGISLIQDLSRDIDNIVVINPKKSKEIRFNSVTSVAEKGDLYIRDDQDWKDIIIEELLNFPKIEHDDRIDAISQFVNWWQYDRFENILNNEPSFGFL